MGIQGLEHVLYDQEDLFINSLALPRVRKREKSCALSVSVGVLNALRGRDLDDILFIPVNVVTKHPGC